SGAAIPLRHVHRRMPKDRLYVVRNSASVEEQRRQCVPQIMDTKIRPIKSGANSLPIDEAANVRRTQPPAARTSKHQLSATLALNPPAHEGNQRVRSPDRCRSEPHG